MLFSSMPRSSHTCNLTILIPGLLEGAEAVRCPALERLMARADFEHTDGRDFEAVLQALFPRQIPPGRELPVAALCRLAQIGQGDSAMWLCADPVHLIADQRQVYLTAHTTLGLNDDEAERLVAELNRLYAEDGWEFVIGSAHHWYLRIPESQPVTTTPLRKALGHSIGPLLPQGSGGIHWPRLMNEMQMLLHGCSINQEREMHGRLPVNGIWLWGAGTLPPATESGELQALWSDDCLMRGLALRSGTPVYDLPVDFADWQRQAPIAGSRVIAFDALQEPGMSVEARAQWLLRWEEAWARPLLEALRNGSLQSLTLGDGATRTWRIDRRAMRRFWRRQRPLSHYQKSS